MTPILSNEQDSRATKQWEFLDWDGTLGVVESWEQLQPILQSVPQRAYLPNTIVDLYSPSGDTLSVGIAGPLDKDNSGIGKPLACLNFTNASLNPPYLTVVGDTSLSYESGGVVVFKYNGTWTEILRRNCVPVETMLQIAKHFYDTGSLPTWIAWEEV